MNGSKPDDFHPQSGSPFGDDPADIAEADDADGFVAELDANEFIALPFAALRDATACGMWRASAIIKEIVCSPVVTLLPPGVFMTTMPRLVAASASIFSKPTPARPITLRFFAASINSAVILVPLRITQPS